MIALTVRPRAAAFALATRGSSAAPAARNCFATGSIASSATPRATP